MTDASVAALWQKFRLQNPTAPEKPVAVFHFCDNHDDAETCLRLVLSGKKRATAASLKELELSGDPVPTVGDYSVVTDYAGKAHAVIETTGVEITRFADVDEQFARTEGEGDLTLAWWREAHAAYFSRVLQGTGTAVDDDLPIACEHFKVVLAAETR